VLPFDDKKMNVHPFAGPLPRFDNNLWNFAGRSGIGLSNFIITQLPMFVLLIVSQ
jgi:hypothetical protein